eukprot:symbB.v1.2.022458.t1/scaffold1993.1/size93368/3
MQTKSILATVITFNSSLAGKTVPIPWALVLYMLGRASSETVAGHRGELQLCHFGRELVAGTRLGIRFTSEGFGAGSHHLQCSLGCFGFLASCHRSLATFGHAIHPDRCGHLVFRGSGKRQSMESVLATCPAGKAPAQYGSLQFGHILCVRTHVVKSMFIAIGSCWSSAAANMSKSKHSPFWFGRWHSAWEHAFMALQEMSQLRMRPGLISYSSLMARTDDANIPRRWERAMTLLATLRQTLVALDSIAANAFLGACTDSHWQLSLHLLTEYVEQSIRTDIVAMNEVSVALGQALQWRRVFSFLVDSISGRMGWNVFVDGGAQVSFNALAAAAGVERWDLSLFILKDLRGGVVPDIIALNSAINACKKNEKWSSAMDLLSAISISRLYPSLITFNALIGACDFSHWRSGLMILRKLQGCTSPSEVTCSSIITSSSRTWEVVLHLHESDMPSQRLQPSFLTTSALLSSVSGSSRWQHVLQILNITQGYDDAAMNALNYCTAVTSTILAGQLNQASTLMMELQDRTSLMLEACISEYGCDHASLQTGLVTLGKRKMVTQGARKQRKGSKEKQNLNKLKEICNKIAACRRRDDWRTAWHLLTTLDAHSLRCNIILQNAAMNACGKCRRWKEAFCILQMSKLSSLQCDVVSYNTMVPLLRWPLALALLFPPRGLRWDIVTFNSLAASSTMPWHQVFTTFQIVSKQSVEADPVTYNSAIRASDQWKRSQKLVVSMVKDQLKCDVVTYTSCMTACRWFISSQWLAHFATRHLDGNLMTFNSMINESTGLWCRASVIFTLIPLQWRLEPDVISHNSVLSCNHDRWPVAVDLFQSMQCDGTRPSIITYNTLSGICDRHHFWRLSLALGGLAITQPWYRALSSPSCNELEMRSMRCSATINACAQSGWQRAAQLLSKMQQESTEPNIIVYNSFLSSCDARQQHHHRQNV